MSGGEIPEPGRPQTKLASMPGGGPPENSSHQRLLQKPSPLIFRVEAIHTSAFLKEDTGKNDCGPCDGTRGECRKTRNVQSLAKRGTRKKRRRVALAAPKHETRDAHNDHISCFIQSSIVHRRELPLFHHGDGQNTSPPRVVDAPPPPPPLASYSVPKSTSFHGIPWTLLILQYCCCQASAGAMYPVCLSNAH